MWKLGCNGTGIKRYCAELNQLRLVHPGLVHTVPNLDQTIVSDLTAEAMRVSITLSSIKPYRGATRMESSFSTKL